MSAALYVCHGRKQNQGLGAKERLVCSVQNEGQQHVRVLV